MPILLILLLAFGLRLYRLDAQSIWWDEGHSIQMASAPVAQIPSLPGMDVHPPGYFVLLHQWMTVVGRSEFALRYLSAIFSLLTVVLLMRFGWELAGQQVGRRRLEVAMIAGGLAALSPLYIAYAQEVRMYAAVTFFALISVYFQWRILKEWKGERWAGQPSSLPIPHTSNWHIAAYILATAVSLYTHYFTIFLLLFQNLAWLVWIVAQRWASGWRRRWLTVWLGSQIAVLILFLPQLSLALRQTSAYANPNLNAPGIGEFVSRSWLTYTVGTALSSPTGSWLAGALALILGFGMAINLINMRREGYNRKLGTIAYLLGWLLVPLVAYYLVLQRRPSFEPRYMMLVTPALALLLAWGLGATSEWPVRSLRLGWERLGLLIALVSLGMGTWAYFTNVESYKDDSAGVAAWLAAETTSQDLVYVDVPHPFHYYAGRISAPTHYLFVDVHTAADILNSEAAGRKRIFWVTWRGSDTDPRGVIPFLLDKAARRAGELDFRGYHVTWWDLPAEPRFSLPTELVPSEIMFGDVVRLDGLAFSRVTQAGEAAWVTLHFTLLRDVDVDYRVSLRLRTLTGDMLPPADKDLLNDRHMRTSDWPMEDTRLNQAINVYTLSIPPESLPGDYCLEAVVYEANTLKALPVVSRYPDGCTLSGANDVSARLGSVSVLAPVQGKH